MHIGKRLKDEMDLQKVTTKAMAAHCDISPGAVSNWFATGRISKPNLSKACALLKIDMSAFVDGEVLPAQSVHDQKYSSMAINLARKLDAIDDEERQHMLYAGCLLILSGNSKALEALGFLPTKPPANGKQKPSAPSLSPPHESHMPPTPTRR